MATPGGGTTNHLLSELMQSTLGLNWITVHYKGNAPASTDLLAGHVHFNYVKLQLHEGGLQECLPLFEQVTEVPIVIDHMARVDMALGPGSPTARLMLQLLARGNWWVMLSNGHKLSRQGAPWDDAVEMAKAFIEAAPTRMVWASDWPHPLSSAPVPNDTDLLELLYRSAPDKQVLQNILVDNPARVFGFDR